MDEFINAGTISMAFIVAVIMGISQVVKQLDVNPKWLPLLNLFTGVICCIVLTEGSLQIRVLNGLVAGLMASGLYSSQKNVREGIEEKQ